MRARWRRALGLAALAVTLAWPAAADLPAGKLLLARAETFDTHSLPLLLALPGGTYSTIGVGVSVAVVSHDSDDLVILDSSAGTVRVLAAPDFVPPVATAWYFRPGESRALRSQVVPGGVYGPTFEVQEVGSETLAALLDPVGSVMVFDVPEPGFALSLVAGVMLLRGLAHRRRVGAAVV